MGNEVVIGVLAAILRLRDELTPQMQDVASKFAAKTADMGLAAVQAGASLTENLTRPLVGLAKGAIDTGIDFEKTMNQIRGTLTPTAAEMDRVRAVAMQMGADTVFTSKDAAQAILELGKAGFETGKAIDAVPRVLELAAASGWDMGRAAEMAARTMNAFGLETKDLGHINDVLAKAVNTTSLGLQDLATGFKYVGPIAQGFGMSIEQTSAALGMMRDHGIAAETAGRALREGLSRLANPVKSVEQVMAELGIESFKVNGHLMNLSEIVQILHDKGLTAEQALKLFGQAAGPGMFTLVQQGRGALDGLTAELKNADGAAAKMAKAMMDGPPGAIERLKGSIDNFKLSVFNAMTPSINLIANTADAITSKLGPALASLPVPIQTGIVIFGGLVAALGPVLSTFGQLAIGVSGLSMVFPGLATAIGSVATAIGAALVPAIVTMLPFIAVGGAIVLGVIAIYEAWKHWDEIVAFFKGAFAYVITQLQKMPDWLLALSGPIGAVVLAFKHWDEIKKIAEAVYTAVKEWLVDKFNAVVQSIKSKVDAVTGFFAGMYDKVVGHSYVPDMIRGIGSEFGKLESIMSMPAKLATTAVEHVFDAMAKKVGTIVDGLLSHIGLGMERTASQMSGFGSRGFGDSGGSGSGSSGFGGSFKSSLGAGLGGGLADMAVDFAKDGLKALFNHFQGGEEAKVVNPLRDTFFAEFGGYQGLANQLTGATDGNIADALIKQLYNAETKQQFDAATEAIRRKLDTVHKSNERGFEDVADAAGDFGRSISDNDRAMRTLGETSTSVMSAISAAIDGAIARMQQLATATAAAASLAVPAAAAAPVLPSPDDAATGVAANAAISAVASLGAAVQVGNTDLYGNVVDPEAEGRTGDKSGPYGDVNGIRAPGSGPNILIGPNGEVIDLSKNAPIPSVPHIPPNLQFATGTRGQYLDFGKGTLAMLHGKERVMTEGEAGGGGLTIQVNVHGNVLGDSEDFKQCVTRAVLDGLEKGGPAMTKFRILAGQAVPS